LVGLPLFSFSSRGIIGSSLFVATIDAVNESYAWAAARTLSKIRGRGYNIDQEMTEMETADRLARQVPPLASG
jgi:hypothetical protein